MLDAVVGGVGGMNGVVEGCLIGPSCLWFSARWQCCRVVDVGVILHGLLHKTAGWVPSGGGRGGVGIRDQIGVSNFLRRVGKRLLKRVQRQFFPDQLVSNNDI